MKIAEIAEREQIPIRFLEVILNQLKGGGFVQSRRGAEGGYRLARPADQLTVGEIMALHRRTDRPGRLRQPDPPEGLRIPRRVPLLLLLGPGPSGDLGRRRHDHVRRLGAREPRASERLYRRLDHLTLCPGRRSRESRAIHLDGRPPSRSGSLHSLLADMQELSGTLAEGRPGSRQREGLVVGFFVERFRAAARIHLDELHHAVHPRRCDVVERRSPEADDDLGTARWISRPRI